MFLFSGLLVECRRDSPVSKWELRANPGLKKDEVITMITIVVTTRHILTEPTEEEMSWGVSGPVTIHWCPAVPVLTEDVELGPGILTRSGRLDSSPAGCIIPSSSGEERASSEETDVLWLFLRCQVYASVPNKHCFLMPYMCLLLLFVFFPTS